MPSPWVQRLIEAQDDTQHRVERFAEPTLGDRVRADRLAPSEAEIASLIEDERQHRAERTAYDLTH